MGREGLLRRVAVFPAVYHHQPISSPVRDFVKPEVGCLGQNIRVRLATGGLGFVGVTRVAEKR